MENKLTEIDFGLVERPWSTDWRGISPPFSYSELLQGGCMSYFIDKNIDNNIDITADSSYNKYINISFY